MPISPGLMRKGMALFLMFSAGWMVQTSWTVEIQVKVELQGAVEEAFERDVYFVAADAGGAILNSWTETLTFSDGIGETTLFEASEDMAFLSAKTKWTLRRRIACEPDEEGQAEAAFTEDAELRGGDLNGDNQVDMLDFGMLRYHWYTENEAADITGNGKTGMPDYNILQSNWYVTGDPE